MATHNERQTYIEEMGLLMESLGSTRMAGRILGYIFVTDKEEVSFDELVEVLKASKSSISTNVKSLTHIGYVKAVSLPGDRKTYYRLEEDFSWADGMRARLKFLEVMTNRFRKALELRARKNDRTSHWLSTGVEFYDYVNREFPAFLAKWEASRT